jgi:formylmethanofuran dehydrogenase subunit C
VKPLVLTLKERPAQRLDLSPLVPHRLIGKSALDIAKLELQTTRARVTVGDAFRVRDGDARAIRIEADCDRLDQVGEGMTDGSIVVDGSVGSQTGRRMAGGHLTIKGNTGPWAGSGMAGGEIEIIGSAGDRLGGPLPGETSGMRGGVVVVRGNVGDRAGDRMRRGVVIVEGSAGSHAGSRMIAGTLVVRRKAGALPGYLMRRGTIILGDGSDVLSPTFLDSGIHELVAMRLLAAFVNDHSAKAASALRRPLRRLAGDMAVLGKGELFCAPG